MKIGTVRAPNYCAWPVVGVTGKKFRDGKLFYRIKWEDTWEPVENCLDCMCMIKEFEEKQQLHPQLRTRLVKPMERGLEHAVRQTTKNHEKTEYVGEISKPVVSVKIEDSATNSGAVPDLKYLWEQAIQKKKNCEKTEVGEISKRFEGLSVNTENCAINSDSESEPEPGPSEWKDDMNRKEKRSDEQCHSDSKEQFAPSKSDVENTKPKQDDCARNSVTVPEQGPFQSVDSIGNKEKQSDGQCYSESKQQLARSGSNVEITKPTRDDCAKNSISVPEQGIFQSMDNIGNEKKQSNEQCHVIPAKSIPINKYTIEKLRKCSSSEVKIVGVEHSHQGITIGVRSLDDENVFKFDCREVNNLWHQLYATFMESHVQFDEKNVKPAQNASYSDLATTPINHRSMVSVESTPINEYTIDKLRRCSSKEIEIVGAEPSGQGIRIGVCALVDDKVFTLDSREVTELWPQLYATFLDSHIRFRSDEL